MNVKHKVFVLGAALLLMVNLQASAGPVSSDPNPETWPTGTYGAPTPWAIAPGGVSGKAHLANPSGYLQINLDEVTMGDLTTEEKVYTTIAPGAPKSLENFSGAGLSLQFLFKALDVGPNSAMVYLHPSGTAASHYWQYTFVDETVTGVGSFQQNIQFVYGFGNGWTLSDGEGSSGDFTTALASIDRIGVGILRTGINAQTYGLDDWGYYTAVPEPGVVCVLLSALLSMALIFRKRLRFARA